MQTITKTASFLGYDDAITFYNEGNSLDMFSWNELAEEELKTIKLNKIEIDHDFYPAYISKIDRDTIKEQLTSEIVIDILLGLGIEVVGNKAKLRDERTHSAKIYSDGGLKDFGSSEKVDIFQVVMDTKGISFYDAMKYVNNYI